MYLWNDKLNIMLTELINFTQNLSDDFKSLGLLPKEGLHIVIQVGENACIKTNADSITYDFYSKKSKKDLSEVLKKCMLLHENAWCVNTNKCYDLPLKAMHTCSPFCLGFKREHLIGGKKFEANMEKKKPQLQERFDTYFSKANELIYEEEEKEQTLFSSFSDFFQKGSWEVVLNDILQQRQAKYELLSSKIETLNNELKGTKDKNIKANLKEQLDQIQQDLLIFQPLADNDYVLFYLELDLDLYKKVHQRYLGDKLFNTSDFNTEPDADGIIYGTSDFQNGFNSKMPFLLHKTASFDISGRISNIDAQILYEFSKVLPRKTLPNPLPIFIYNDEFKQKVISLYKEKKIGFRELIGDLYNYHNKDFQNYYLLNWSNTKDGVVFNDFDFVPKFQYELDLEIQNLFELKEESKKHYPKIKTIFQLEDIVFKNLIENKYHKVDYFSDLKKDDYERRDLTFLSFCKYRKAVYDYVYKSNRNTIGGKEFDEMIFNAIKDDLKNGKEYGIKEKLNFWYSLYNEFNQPNNTLNMASKLKEYQQFVDELIADTANAETCTDEHFAFAAGQVIYYLLKKSKSDDTSFRLMEPYLQKTNCKALQENITEDFKRYKHEIFSNNFKKVSAFVLSYETEVNMKKLQPQLLSGLFAQNQLFPSNNNSNNNN